MKYLPRLVIAVLLSVSASSALALSLNDISILLPLPEASQYQQLISPAEGTGPQGILIPTTVFKALPQLIPEFPNSVTYRDQLKLVAIRLDPCFTEGEGPQNCRKQIRLVWQPVFVAADTVTTRDAGVHSFYEFDDATFDQLLQDWQKLSSGKPTDALQIHPQLRQEGYEGPYWKYLRTMIFKYCGEKNLVRVTAMNVMNGELMWIFQGFDVVGGQTKNIQVARIGGMSQGVIVSSPQFASFTGGMMPPPQQDPAFSELIKDSATTKKKYSEEQIKKIMVSVYEYENPTKHNPGTLDCASCHLANSARQWGQAHFNAWDWKKEFANVAYQSTWNLENTTPGPLRTNRLRAFGYFINQPAISQRVVNETAATMMFITR
ncbi:MAG: hypothetical protein JSU04_17100 [Bdellovibrionales bacterium]|nr:hypothetical protein [Bdellovibrionales bacterium]